MQDKTITNALLHLRAQIIRGQLDGLDHVDALLVSRGYEPAQHQVKRKQSIDRFPRSAMRLLVMAALRHGPKTNTEVAAYVADHSTTVTYNQAMRRVHQALARMETARIVHKQEGVWRIVDKFSIKPPAASSLSKPC